MHIQNFSVINKCNPEGYTEQKASFLNQATSVFTETNGKECACTTAIDIAAALLALGYQLQSVVCRAVGNTLYTFEQQRGTDKTMDKYDDEDVMVSARTYYQALEMLRSYSVLPDIKYSAEPLPDVFKDKSI